MTVHGSAPLRVPVGPDAERWKTFHGEHTVVAVARTVTSTLRVLDVMTELFHSAPGLDPVFAYDPGSAFNDGVYDLLRTAEGRVMPWDQLAGLPCELIVTATENADLPEGDCPVLVLPHGVGFNKQVPDARSSGDRLSGAVPEALLESGRAWLAVSHPDQAAQLTALYPKAADRTLLVGDPCYDQLLAGRRQRDRYRRALGLTAGQRLIVVSSTWRSQSLIGRDPELPARLLAELPMDEYRVAAIMHPNVWFGHGPWTIRALQRKARDAGLLLIPPTDGWQATLIAADALIGDHGSVTFYGAALGLPVLLATFGEESVPGTPMAELGRTAARLDPGAGLREQLDRAVRDHDPHSAAKIADAAFAVPGRALELLRTAAYRLMGLPEPAGPPPAPLTFDDPEPEHTQVTAASVTTTVTGTDDSWTVDVSRRPAAAAADAEETADTFAHLACDEDERDSRLAESASVLTKRDPAGTAVAALRWIGGTLARFPGCRLAAAAVGGGFLVGLRDGRVVEVAATGPVTDPGLTAAVVYACLRAGLPMDGIVALRAGPHEADVALRTRPTRP